MNQSLRITSNLNFDKKLNCPNCFFAKSIFNGHGKLVLRSTTSKGSWLHHRNTFN